MPHGLLRALVAPLLYLAGALLYVSAVWPAASSSWVGGCCDQEQSIWFLAWLPYAVGHGQDPLFTSMLNAPAGVNLMWNAAVLPVSLMAWPVLAVGGPILAYNAMIVVALAGSSWLAFVVLRRYADGMTGPVLGGAVYGFSPYVASHAAIHLNLATAWGPPLFLLALDELLVRRRMAPWRVGVALGLISTLQLLIAEEVLATSVIAAGVLIIVAALARRGAIREQVGRVATALTAATGTFLLAASWPLYMQFFGPQRVYGRAQDSETFSTDVLNLILPTPYQYFAPDAVTTLSRRFSGLYHEATAYIGLPLLVLLVVYIWRRWDDHRVRIAGVVAVVMFVLSLGPNLHLDGSPTGLPMPWLAVARLPVVENILPARMTLFVWLAVGTLVALLANEARRLGRKRACLLIGILSLACAAAMPAPPASSTVEIPTFFRDWAQEGMRSDAIVLVAPYFRGGGGAAPMLWAAFAGNAVRMPEAYAYVPDATGKISVGTAPSQLTSVMEAIQKQKQLWVVRGPVRQQVANDLHDRGVTDVIVGPMDARAAMVDFFADLFGRPPEVVDGVWIWRDVDRVGVVPDP